MRTTVTKRRGAYGAAFKLVTIKQAKARRHRAPRRLVFPGIVERVYHYVLTLQSVSRGSRGIQRDAPSASRCAPPQPPRTRGETLLARCSAVRAERSTKYPLPSSDTTSLNLPSKVDPQN